MPSGKFSSTFAISLRTSLDICNALVLGAWTRAMATATASLLFSSERSA